MFRRWLYDYFIKQLLTLYSNYLMVFFTQEALYFRFSSKNKIERWRYCDGDWLQHSTETFDNKKSERRNDFCTV